MKAILVTYNQVLEVDVERLLTSLGQRGYTRWMDVQGRGSEDGEPRMGTHTWPGMNGAVICMVEEERYEEVMEALRGLDEEGRGLRAFSWSLEDVV